MRVLFLGLIVCLVGCSQVHTWTTPDPAKVDKRPALIVIPGYYGTALRDAKTHRRVFITANETLFGSEALSLYQKDLLTPPGPEVEPESVLDSVSIIPGVYSLDVYGGLLRHLNKWRDVQIIPFNYDWRQDLPTTAAKLEKLVLALKASGVPRVDLFAHSMGGMIADYYLGYGGQDPLTAKLDWRGAREVNRVVIMGTPFRGVFSTFRNMSRGVDLSGNTALFPAETVASFPSCFQLTAFNGHHLKNAKGDNLPLDLNDPRVWREDEVGLYRHRDGISPEVQERRDRFMTEQILRARAFNREMELADLDRTPPPPNVKILNVIGHSRKTIDAGFQPPLGSKEHFIFDLDDPTKHDLHPELLFVDGDGTVSLDSAQTPEGLKATTKVLLSTYSHESLFSDPEIMKAYARFLGESPD